MKEKKEKILTRNFCFSFLSMFSLAMVMYMLVATVTDYVSEFGASVSVAGFVSGVYVVGGMFSRLYSGHGLARFGWKRLALVFLLLHFIACCFYPFITNVPLLIIVRFIHGVGFGAGSSAVATIGMSVLPLSRFGEAAGYLMMATTLAVGIGPFAGGFVYDALGNTACFVFASIMSFLGFFFLLFVDIKGIDPGAAGKDKNEESGEAAAPVPGEIVKYKGINRILETRVIGVSMITCLSAFGYVSVMSFYRLFAKMTDLESQFGYFFLLYAALLVFFRPFAGKLQDRYGNKPVCIPGILAQTAGLLLLAAKPCVLTMIICAVGCAAGFGTLNSACNVMACQRAPFERRSYVVSTYYLMCDIGMGIGPALLGMVAGASNYYIMYTVAAAITLLALPLFLITERNFRPY